MTRITTVMWNSYLPLFRQAGKSIGIQISPYSTRDLEENPERVNEALSAMENADIIILYRTGSPFWEEITDRIREIGREKPVISVGYEASSFLLSTVDPEIVRMAYTYITRSGAENIENLLRYLCHELLSLDLTGNPPLDLPWEGLYHPETSQYFRSAGEYLAWYPAKPDRPWVGILISRTAWVTGNLEIETELIRDLEEEGLNVLPVFTYSLRDLELGTRGMAEIIEDIFLDPAVPRISALIKLVAFFIGTVKQEGRHERGDLDRGRSILSRLNIPIFEPVISYYGSISDWESGSGLTNDIGWSVAMPEFEGVIEPIIIGAQTSRGDEAGKRVCIPDRCRKVARRVARWVRLAAKPVASRKVAFILLNSPCAGVESNIGSASHLDALESMVAILRRMKEAGYQVEVPESGAALVAEFLEKRAISEFRWTTTEDIVRRGGCICQMSPDEYLPFWESLSPEVRSEMIASWGEPPGSGMVHEGKILITGLRYGNALLCIQPKRGCYGARCDGEVCKILHDPHIPPTHQYLATYYYLDAIFGADLLVHVGTHGNLEFLPGKGAGLSKDCYPDIAIGEIPHVYIYNSDNPAEGTIAKRRSYAVLVDYMQSLMITGGLYDHLADLDRILAEYETARFDPARSHALMHEIWDLLKEMDLEHELPISPETPEGEVIRQLHEYLTRIRQTRIAAGMHILGSLPEGEEEVKYIYSILGYESGKGSLRDIMAERLGYDLSNLIGTDDIPPGERSNDDRFAEIEEAGMEFIRDTLSRGGDGTPIAGRIIDIHQRIAASDEIGSLLAAFSGAYVHPGPSGLITHGRDDVLPTGRNFYSLDPHRIPTKASLVVGEQLAFALLKKYHEETGRLPESVALYWMGNDVMWTDGEGLAQMFALLGVKPTWEKNGRVNGFRIIPLEELGRPRIDLVVRCSGMIRDNFSNLISLLDEVIDAVASLDEPPEENYLRKHILESMQKGAGWRDATLRIFSSRPGTYTSGVNLAVYASAWKDESDLAGLFVENCGYGYGRDVSGSEAQAQFADRLAGVDLTFNKLPSDEYDLLGCCCYFANQGGMTAAARILSGKEVPAYFGDTREEGRAKVSDLADEVRRVVRGKLLNPAWIAGMKEHGYAGAAEMAKRIVRVYGWDATADVVDDSLFDAIAETFVNDPEMKEFFEKNPYAQEEIARRLLEAEERGVWNPDPDVLDRLKHSYLEIESWMEGEDHEGEFQGGSVDIIGLSEEEMMRWQMNSAHRLGRESR